VVVVVVVGKYKIKVSYKNLHAIQLLLPHPFYEQRQHTFFIKAAAF
jgi:hypothetical protein